MPTTKFIWDEQNYLAEADDADAINVVYTNEPQQYGNLVSTCTSGTAHFHHFDVFGSTVQLTQRDARANVSYRYNAFGQLIAQVGVTAINLRWTGILAYYFDPETDTEYIRHRPYSPSLGRWSTPDPISLFNGTNLYLYAHNRPLTRVDPSGLADQCYHLYDMANPSGNRRRIIAIICASSRITALCTNDICTRECIGSATITIEFNWIPTNTSAEHNQARGSICDSTGRCVAIPQAESAGLDRRAELVLTIPCNGNAQGTLYVTSLLPQQVALFVQGGLEDGIAPTDPNEGTLLSPNTIFLIRYDVALKGGADCGDIDRDSVAISVNRRGRTWWTIPAVQNSDDDNDRISPLP